MAQTSSELVTVKRILATMMGTLAKKVYRDFEAHSV